jgi:hypothetical protein
MAGNRPSVVRQETFDRIPDDGYRALHAQEFSRLRMLAAQYDASVRENLPPPISNNAATRLKDDCHPR